MLPQFYTHEGDIYPYYVLHIHEHHIVTRVDDTASRFGIPSLTVYLVHLLQLVYPRAPNPPSQNHVSNDA